MTLRFVGDLPLWAGGLLALAGAWLALGYYRRETRRVGGHLGWLLPVLRSAAILLTILILTGPVIHHRTVEGELGEVILLLDASSSMATRDAHMPIQRKVQIAEEHHWVSSDDVRAGGRDIETNVANRFDASTRFDRLRYLLNDEAAGMLKVLRQQHHVKALLLDGDRVTPIWDSTQMEMQDAFGPLEAKGFSTQLGQGLGKAIDSESENASDSQEKERRRAIVLLTDGQNNGGVSPVQVARVLGTQKVPIYTLGFGDTQEPIDPAILGADYSQRVFAKNRVRGTLRLKERVPAGQPIDVTLECSGEVVWTQTITSLDSGDRELEFDLPVEELTRHAASQLDQNLQYSALPIELSAKISSTAVDSDETNNVLPMRLVVITQSYRVLLIDGRSRWESRYLKNAFQRDNAWELTSVIPHDDGSVESLPAGEGENRFPADRAALLSYDLIVFGDVPPTWLTDEQKKWIREYVEFSGGGMIWIDGSRGNLKAFNDETLGPLLPVKWVEGQPAANWTERLTETGSRHPAFVLQGTQEENERFWPTLPGPRWSAFVEALPGSQVLVETGANDKWVPAFVSNRFGAGQVLYVAHDETWRWRYQVADTYHQRFWNQIARSVMRKPMAVSDDYVALDSGPVQYAVGDSADIRVRLTDASGRGVGNGVVEALLWRNGSLMGGLLLTGDPQNPGFYAGSTGPLEAGEYEVSIRAAGYPASAMKARTRFSVTGSGREESLRVACNETLLTQLADESGGKYLPEESWRDLSELLSPLSTGRVHESDTVLWQSYWWFVAILTLLAAEWWLRKRGGLV